MPAGGGGGWLRRLAEVVCGLREYRKKRRNVTILSRFPIQKVIDLYRTKWYVMW